MAQFRASLSMSRLAGTSGTERECEMTKSRSRTGGRRQSKKSCARRPPAHAKRSFRSLGELCTQMQLQVQTAKTQ